ncbi:ATP-dependent Clp protease ATP-binding subunit CLPT2, chloroplastic-like [Primulina tabacum]|uniref:ATP-dependent Clp protease ATP-binding subunit CLPT2, chloroplastic-like n=1 Tax=Primulina tabacum TaxID=48773 RepID=UPI003F594359
MAARSLFTVSTRMTGTVTKQHNQDLLIPNSLNPSNSLRSQWLGNTAIKFTRHPSNLGGPFSPKYPPINATVSLSLPTVNPEAVGSAEKLPKWSSKAIKSFAMGELEARKIKSPNTGTEALLMGILIEGTSFASKFLRANGVTLLKVRDEIGKKRGKLDMFFFSPEHPPLTEATQRALDWAVNEKLKSGENGEITTAHMLVGLWQQQESLGHRVLVSLGFSDEKAKELHSLISEPGFKDD